MHTFSEEEQEEEEAKKQEEGLLEKREEGEDEGEFNSSAKMSGWETFLFSTV